MGNSKSIIFTSPAECEKSFYEAIANKNHQLMQSVWAIDEDVICVLPSGVVVQGYDNVCDFWYSFFQKTIGTYNLTVNVRQQTKGVMLTAHNIIEELVFLHDNNKPQKLTSIAMNLFIRTADGWRLLAHQATTCNERSLTANPDNEKKIYTSQGNNSIH